MSGPAGLPVVERLAIVKARVGEAPLWLPDRKVWLWLDLQGRAVHRYDPASGADRIIATGFAEDLACLLRWTADHALLVSVTGFHRLALDTGWTEPLACPVALPVGTIFNDGKVDRQGALWIGSSDAAETAPLGRLWRLARGEVSEIAAGFIVSNGPAFAPDGSAAYFADTFGRRLLRFALNETGSPVSQTGFATLPEAAGFPDGMTTDSAGILHVGHWDGGLISRWTPGGTGLTPIPVPARNVTALAFGGDDLRQAVITTASLFPGQTAGPNPDPDPDFSPDWQGDLLGMASPVAGLSEPLLAVDWMG